MPLDTIHLPAALARGVILDGLTAPAIRAAIVMLAASSQSGAFSIMKPDLERWAGLRLDNADRFMNRLRSSEVMIGDASVRAFESINYTPGVQKRLAGIIDGRLSPQLVEEISRPQHGGGTVAIAIDELRRLTTVPGILMLLWLADHRGDDRLRIDEPTALQMFGPYIARAAITRRTKRDGEHAWTGLSRIFSELVAPGVKDLWDALADLDVDAAPVSRSGRGHGRAWSCIEVTVARRVHLPSVRELAAKQRDQEDYERRRFDGADPSKIRATGSAKSQRPGASVPDNEGA